MFHIIPVHFKRFWFVWGCTKKQFRPIFLNQEPGFPLIKNDVRTSEQQELFSPGNSNIYSFQIDNIPV